LAQQAKDLDRKREDLIRQAAPEGEASVLVSGRIYPGVTIVISGRSATINQEIRGPVRILERKIEGVTTLFAVDTISGSAVPLPTARFTAQAEKQAIEASNPAACAPAGA
jgi:hypothetical protein